jgi:uncharacterized membrane protein YedE/YeeE
MRIANTLSSQTKAQALTLVIGLAIGLVFGLGLIVSGMSNPAKVRNFLDIFGSWDPSLAFVMGGAIAVGILGFWFIQRRLKPVLTGSFELPTNCGVIDRKILPGAAAFGLGWALTGICPGPALTLLAGNGLLAVGFVAMMLAGMFVGRLMKS